MSIIRPFGIILLAKLLLISFWGCEKKEPEQDMPPMIKISRNDLLKQKKETLKKLVDQSEARKKFTFEAALKHYEELLSKPENKSLGEEKVQILRDDSTVDQPVIDLTVKKLYPINIEYTPDWMHYHDNATIKKWVDKGIVVSYLDYANASLGGGAFTHGWVQEEQMVAFCAEFGLLLAGEPWKKTEDTLKDKANINFVTRSTREPDRLSPRPKYLVNIRCTTGTPVGTQEWKDTKILEHNDNAPAINIVAAATVNVLEMYINGKKVRQPQADYTLLDLEDLFSNIYRAFELVKNTNANKENVIFGGRIGGGVFGQSVLMSAAMQVLAGRLLGIENLVLTGQTSASDAAKYPNIYLEAVDKMNNFLANNNIIGMKIGDVLRDFLAHVKNDPKWQKNTNHK